MRVRRGAALFAICAILFGASRSVCGEEKVAIPAEPVWRVGDIVTRTFSSAGEAHHTWKGADGVVTEVQYMVRSLSATMVEEVLEVGKSGEPTRTLVHVKEWEDRELLREFDKGAKGEQKDTWLRGATVETRGHAADRTWRLLGPMAGKKPTTKAENFLAIWCGSAKGTDSWARTGWGPKSAVAVGESWKLDVKPILDARGRLSAVDVAKSGGVGRLRDVEGGRAHVTFSLTFPHTALYHSQFTEDTPWTRGGIVSLEWEEWTPVDGRPFPAQVKRQVAFDGAYTKLTSQGRLEIEAAFKYKAEISVVAGGEIPAAGRLPPAGEVPAAARPPAALRTVVLQDVQALAGGQALWASRDGKAYLQVVTPPKPGQSGLQEKRYRGTFTRDQWAEIEKRVAANEFLSLQVPDRSGGAGEARTGIAVTTADGSTAKARKWASDGRPRFDLLAKFLRGLGKTSGQVLHEGPYEPGWKPDGFERPW